MFNLSNSLSFLRAPLALLLLVENTTCRVVAILLAMLTDSADGYLARKRKAVTRLGAVLDPAMDKLFVSVALIVFWTEGNLALWQGCAMIARDFFLCVFALYLGFSGFWSSYTFTAIRWGKISTALQFLVLIGLSFDYTFPNYFYGIFVLLGLLAFIELVQLARMPKMAKQNTMK
jgi:CDP-diacylglycerol--glycerol-3-phosphate 3-phosphatidyltransferase